jgi:hypothetical protein
MLNLKKIILLKMRFKTTRQSNKLCYLGEKDILKSQLTPDSKPGIGS